MSANPEQSSETENVGSNNRMVVIDIGKRKRKLVRKLRKGEGRLADEIEHTVGQLKSEGVLDADAQTVVVVVRQKPKNNWMWP